MSDNFLDTEHVSSLHQLGLHTSPSTSEYSSALQLAVHQAETLLNNFFAEASSEAYFNSIFGNAGTDLDDFKQRLSCIESHFKPIDLLTGITVLSAESMRGVSGAFSSSGPNGESSRIFVNADWIAKSSIDTITGVLIEEVGHAIDYYLNRNNDSIGDEGEIFSLAVRGINPTQDERVAIISENDHILIDFNGQSWLAEAAITTASSTSGSNVNAYVGFGTLISFDPITIGAPSGSVLLNINAYDVDWDNTLGGEHDAVYISGPSLARTFVGFLNGFNGTWTWSTFDVTDKVAQAGNYTVQIEPSVDPGTSRGWFVTARYASLTYGSTNGFITNLTVGSDGKVNSTITVDATDTYTITYYLIDSGNTIVSTYEEPNSLTANTPFNNTGDQLPGWPVADGTYTLRAVLTNSSGVTIRDINTWTVVKSPSGTTTTPVDTTPPTVTISSSDNALKIGDTTVVTFTFSEDVQNFDLADVTSSPNGTFGALGPKVNNGNGTYSYSATFTPTDNIEDATNQFVVGTAWSDIAGNAPSTSTSSANYTVDTRRPTVTISSSDNALKIGDTTVVTFTFSEDVQNFDLADVTSSPNGTFGALGPKVNNGNGTYSYSATFTPTDNIEDATNQFVVATAWSDIAGNAPSTSTSSANYAIDTKRPKIAISSNRLAMHHGDRAQVTFTLSEDSTDFHLKDVTVSGGKLTEWKKVSERVYTAIFSPTNNSNVNGSIIVANNAFTDLAGNTNDDGGEADNTVSITIAPTAIFRSTSPSVQPGSLNKVMITLTEASNNFTLSSIRTSVALRNFRKISDTLYEVEYTAPRTGVVNLSAIAGSYTDLGGTASIANAERLDSLEIEVSAVSSYGPTSQTTGGRGGAAGIVVGRSEPSPSIRTSSPVQSNRIVPQPVGRDASTGIFKNR